MTIEPDWVLCLLLEIVVSQEHLTINIVIHEC